MAQKVRPGRGMAKRDNPYELAFEEYLRMRRAPYVAVDEARRSLSPDRSLKSLDFVVSLPGGGAALVDVKGRGFPAGGGRQYWRNWATDDDLNSLAGWETLFGPGFTAMFVFAYQVRGDRAPLPQERLFAFRNQLYGFVAIRLRDYLAHARRISPRWSTVSISARVFCQLATPMDDLLAPVECATKNAG